MRKEEKIKEKETLLIVQECRKRVVLCWAPWAPVQSRNNTGLCVEQWYGSIAHVLQFPDFLRILWEEKILYKCREHFLTWLCLDRVKMRVSDLRAMSYWTWLVTTQCVRCMMSFSGVCVCVSVCVRVRVVHSGTSLWWWQHGSWAQHSRVETLSSWNLLRRRRSLASTWQL